MRAVLAVAALVVAGCDGGAIQAGPEDACNAGGYAGLVGSDLAAVTLPAALNDRVLGPGDVATLDYDPTRLNIRVDAENRVLSLDCG